MEEIFDIVDEQGKVTGTATRQQCHADRSLIHPVVHLHLFDRQGRLFLQQRSVRKQVFPGYWDTSVGGHIHSRETVWAALLREADEELGLDAAAALFLCNYIWYGQAETEYIHLFRQVCQGEIRINPVEIDAGRFFTTTEIREKLHRDFFTSSFEFEYANYLFKPG